MAATRRLSKLLQEQQEPFLVEVALRQGGPARGRGGSGGGAGGLGCCLATACRWLLRLFNHVFKKRRGTGSAGAGADVGSGLGSALSKVLCSRAMRWVRADCCFGADASELGGAGGSA